MYLHKFKKLYIFIIIIAIVIIVYIILSYIAIKCISFEFKNKNNDIIVDAISIIVYFITLIYSSLLILNSSTHYYFGIKIILYKNGSTTRHNISTIDEFKNFLINDLHIIELDYVLNSYNCVSFDTLGLKDIVLVVDGFNMLETYKSYFMIYSVYEKIESNLLLFNKSSMINRVLTKFN